MPQAPPLRHTSRGEGRRTGEGLGMTWGWVVVGALAQLMLGLFLFMLVVFSASSMDGVGKLARVHSKILTLSLFGLPATCVVSAGMLIHLYRSGGGPSSWWWHAVPL